MTSAATYGTGTVSAAFSFNGSSSVSVPDSSLWAFGTNAFTIELWANFGANSSDRVLVASDTGGGVQEKWIFWLDNGFLRMHLNGSNGAANIGSAAFLPTLNQWYHLGVTRQSSNYTFYINGNPVSTNSDARAVPNANAPLTIGLAEGNFGFVGQLDEISIYDRALSSSEIQSIYAAGSAGKCYTPTTGATVPYFTDFESGVSPAAWSDTRWETTQPTYLTRFAGRFDNAFNVLTLTNVTPGQSYTLTFDFYAIDSWDGGTIPSGDIFAVSANGVQLMRDTFSNFGAQTFPRAGDENRLPLGFEPSWPESIYRSIRFTFVPSNSVASIAFYGQNLEGVANESWGLDNVRVQLTADVTNTIINATTLPVDNSTNSVAIDTFIVAASRPLSFSTANNAANYSLREAGGNGNLGDGDDIILPLTPSFLSNYSVTLTVNSAPLQPGLYRFQTTSGLQDTNGSSVSVFTREFVIANPVVGAIENTSNGSIGTATPLPMTETPASSGLFTAFAVGSFSSTSDQDFWRFNAEAGDRLNVRLESELTGVNPQIQLQNASGSNLQNVNGSGNLAVMQNYVFSTPGTYYLRVLTPQVHSRYEMRVDQARGTQTESEANDTPGTANPLNLTVSPGLYQGKVVGALPSEDANGDYFALGTLNVGNPITAFLQFPTGSVLNASNIILKVYLAGNTNAQTTNLNGNLNFTVLSNGVHYVRIESTNRAIRAHYIANVAISDGVAPVITTTTLPGEGSVSSDVIDRFSLSFSEDLVPSAVSNAANYELRSAGADGAFNTTDDVLYALATTGYSGGLNSDYFISDGPLQVGAYRFTARTNLIDRASNPMAAPFVRQFVVTNVPGFVLEARLNDNVGRAGTFSATTTSVPDGTFSGLTGFAVGDAPEGIVSGDFDHDGDLDLVTANVNSDTLSVMLNDGRGNFQSSTNIPVGDGPAYLVAANLNGDTNLDLVVANYNANTVSVLLGNATGGFTILTNYSGFNRPHFLATADFNKDGKADIAVPNYNATTIRVLLGNGNGTFDTGTNYNVGSTPVMVAVGDFNNDTNLDLAVPNYSSGTVSLFLGNGSGGFQLMTNLPTGANPRSAAIQDVTGDNMPDLVVLQVGDNTVSVFVNNGNGTFQPRRDYFTGTSDGYQLTVADLNADGFKDIIVPGYGNDVLTLMLNDGAGKFTNTISQGLPNGPICAALGDFTGDSVPDLAITRYHSDAVTILTGNAVNPLVESPSTSGMRHAFARGNISSTADLDFFKFSGVAGHRAVVAIETVGAPVNSSLRVELDRLDGSVLTTFNSENTGRGQSVPVVLPYTGTFMVRVSYNNDFQGEYRIRITTLAPPTQFETEANNTIAQANALSLTLSNGHLIGNIAGYISGSDTSGDYYSLGQIAAGTMITVSTVQPSTSGFSTQISIHDSTGNAVATSVAGATNFSYTVPGGQGGSYYARVTASTGGYSTGVETALRFDGNDDYVDMGNWFNYQTFTISMWLNPSASQNSFADIIDNNHTGSRSWVLQYANTGLRFTWGAADGSPSAINIDFAPNQWQHLAITRDATNVNRVYLNGTLIGTTSGTGQIFYDGTQFFRLGRWGGGGRNWNGTMDDLRLWDRALTSAEIAAGMSGSLSGTEPGLVGYWRFNEGTGTTAGDLSPSNRVATLVNGTAWSSLSSSNVASPGLLAQYLARFDITDAQGPSVVSVSLPGEGTSTSSLVNQFNVAFNEEVSSTVNGLNRNIYSFNGHYYLLTDTASSWQDAEAQAVALGGHLVTISSTNENSFLNSTFSSFGTLWIGFNDVDLEGNFTWISGEPASFTFWNNGEPNNSNNEDYGVMLNTGRWNDSPAASYRGIVEVSSLADTDGDGLVNVLDPFPTDPLNAFELRSAGGDNNFGTSDDIIYNLDTTGYTSGTNVSFVIVDGPLQQGNYRFTISTSLRDRFGNALAAPYVRLFSVTNVPGFIVEGRLNDGPTGATSFSTSISNAPDGSFIRLNTYGTGNNPYWIEAGSFNQDTNSDLIVANINSDSLSIYYGSGDGSFQTPTNLLVGDGPIAMTAGDFVGGTNQDLAVAVFYDNQIAIVESDGAGNFQVRSNYTVGGHPRAVVTGDFNGDGLLDLATANESGNSVSILLATTNRTFSLRTNMAFGASMAGIAAGDVNRDGFVDLVAVNYGVGNIHVLLGNGTGTFSNANTIVIGPNPRPVRLVDLNGDTNLDIVTFTTGDDRLRVSFGNGDGTFQTNTAYSIGASDVYHIVAADLDLDGRQDIVIPAYGGNRLMTLLTSADGSLGSLAAYNPGGSPISAAVADLNNDGRPDIATVSYGGSTLHVYLGNNSEPLSESITGRGIRDGRGRGSLWDGNEVDYWSFSGRAGDRVSLAIETVGAPGSSGLRIDIDRADATFATFYSDFNGYGQMQATLPISGTYMVRIQPNYNFTGEYRLRVTVVEPPTEIESEDNNSIANADALAFRLSPGHQTANVLGYLNLADAPGDYYQLGNQTAGTAITLALRTSSFSTIVPTLAIYRTGGVLVTNTAGTNLVYTIPSGGDGAYYARVTSSTLGLLTEYLLDLDVADTQPPFIVADTLPLAGTNLLTMYDRFSLTFSEDMLASTVTNAANYELRNAGANGSFDDSDDQLYTIRNSPAYTIGLGASYLITDGPLQPGAYRFTASTNLSDRPGLQMVSPFIRFFTVSNIADYAMESRTNNTPATATSASLAITNSPDGTVSVLTNITVQSNPYFAASGYLNNDTNLDLVVANYGGDSVSVLLGNGTGGFSVLTNYTGNSGAIQPVLGYFNTDSNLDFAVVNYNGNNVRLYLGNGDGTFTFSTNYSFSSQPYRLATGDLNADGRPDLIVGHLNGDYISVLLGQPAGTFQTTTNYPSGDGPTFVVVGDVNGDNKLDVITANQNSDNLSLFLGNGNGTLAPALSIAVNSTPRALVLRDLNNDGKLDLGVAHGSDNLMSVLIGNGDGSFQTRVNYGSGSSSSYGIQAADLNNDGWLDIIMSGYGNSRMSTFINRRDGTFEPALTYAVGSQPIGIVAEDLNKDGRTDLVLCNYGANYVTVMMGNDSEPLRQDSNDGSIRIGRVRGMLTSGDVDYFSFTATAGSRIAIATENVGSPAASGFYFLIQRPDVADLFGFYSDYNGWGEGSGIAPVTGTYYLRVSENYGNLVEYNVRVTILPGNVQVESEDNSSVGAANAPTFAIDNGHQRATVFGNIARNDGSGDYYRLGNLTVGTIITLQSTKPLSSMANPALAVYNSSGTLLTNAPAGVTNLTFAVGTNDVYYARVTSPTGAGLFATYLLNIDLLDNVGPTITDVTLPPAGSTNLSILDRFSITVNKDLNPLFTGLNRTTKFYNGHAYFLTDNSVTWLDAETIARSVDGHLVTINDLAENDWVAANFTPNFWIGLNDEAQEGNYVWASGQALTYTNWNSGEPNNSGNEDYGNMIAGGKWNDNSVTATMRGLIEVSGTDSDNDGIPDLADLYPNDALNVFDLRSSGGDNLFDTSDDEIYRLSIGAYTSGLTVNFAVLDGPLQPGNYRFRVTPSLRDRFGNGLAGNYDEFFSISNIAYFGMENRSNNTAVAATPLVFVEDPLGLRSAGGRGKLFDGSDSDYWSFTANAGDRMMLATDIPGNPGASQLQYEIRHPNGTVLTTFYPAYTGEGQSDPLVLPTNGTYTVRVSPNYTYLQEYRIRVTVASPPIQLEVEGNENLATATVLPLAVSGETRFANASGYIRASTDLDYYNLGTITNGSTIFLNVRLPAYSKLIPVVSIYNSANQYQTEAGNGRASDGVAEVRVTQTGTYYAVVRGTDNTSGLTEQYVLDVQVVPTGSVSFPNMQVVSIGLPTGGGIQSGQPITFNFNVQNVGSLATPGANWIDRAVMSVNTILGDADDIPLGFLPHVGALAPGAGYFVTNTIPLPEGISGDYYIIVQTDAGNAVNEFLLEGDNITVSSTTFPVALAPYANLVVENLNVTGPDSNRTYVASWTTANRGTGTAPGGFKQRFFVRNTTSGAILINNETTIAGALPVNGTLVFSNSFQATNAGNYIVQVTPDSQDQVYEFDAISHASAEQNTATTNFSIVQFFAVTIQSSPIGAGTLTGGGTYPVGTVVTATAMPNTNTLPYQFVNWTEGGTFQSSGTNYAFTLTRDRTLIANFTLPSFQVSASNNPPAGGTVSGQGTYFYGTTNNLVANANPGYRFTNWTQNGEVVGISNYLQTIVLSNRAVVANYVEANTFHVVTTATSPTNVAVVTGAGTFNNGQQTTITTPVSVTNQGNIYTFREFRLNGAFAGNGASFIKTFSTLDPTNMQFVAFYDVVSVKPVVLAATSVVTNTAFGGFTVVASPIPAGSNLQLTVRFDRSMNTNILPFVVMTNSAPGATQPTITSNGTWFTTTVSNDTYRTRQITLSTGMDGTNRVRVSLAADLTGGIMDPTNVLDLVVDVTPPTPPVITLTSSNDSSANFSWSSYVAPSDLNGFRVYLSSNNFSSVANMTPLTGLSSGARNYFYGGLFLDQQYYAAVAAVDVAGNSATTLTPVPFILPRSIPPAASIQVVALDSDSAQVNWPSYSTANLLGFSGFRLYYETNSFSSVGSLTPKQTLSSGARSVQVDGLDRTRTYYFAIVGYNSANGFNPNVTTATWSDPYAGNITANLTLGGPNQPVVDVLQSMTIQSNAILTVQPGTTIRFAPGAGITVQQGRITANGTALDPIVFTSINDPSNAPAPGSWNGITINSGGGLSLLRHVFVKYGAGLTIDGASPTVDAFTATYNQPAGLTLSTTATLTTSNALIANNAVGALQNGNAALIIRNSVIKNNNTNAMETGALAMLATQNWWGTVVAGEIDASLQGTIDRNNFLLSEPLLTPALGASNNVTQVGTSNVNLRLACRTADSMRLSENSAFTAVFFAPFSNATSFALSPGGGQKTIYAQFRSITGETSAPVSIVINYITAGPTIASFNLAEGEIIGRPTNVTGSASAPLGMAAMEFYVNDMLQATQAGGNLLYRFDVRPFSNAIYRVKLLARDSADHFATLERNISIAPVPPPAPAITSPASDLVINSNTINIVGTAEPLINVRLMRGGAAAGTTVAASNGTFNFSAVALAEGPNAFTAVAYDDVGSANSVTRTVGLDSGPPSAVVLNAPQYVPTSGINVSWQYGLTGERPSKFRVFWHTNVFASSAQASSQSPLLDTLQFTIPSLAAGTYYFAVVGYDDAGNPSPLSNLTSLNYDPVPPSFLLGFNKSSPVGTGALRIIITSSEPLAGTPTFSLRPFNSAPVTLTVSNTALNTYEGTLNVNPSTPSGPMAFFISAQDIAGNVFNGTPAGAAMTVDVQAPTARLVVTPGAPVQVTNSVAATVSLTLSELPKPGTPPQLTFNPPTGSPVPITLSGNGTNWAGTLGLTSAMGSGNGTFSFTGVDPLDNVGHLITSGGFLEIYNTSLPTPPGQPVGFQATPLVSGQVRLSWFAVSNAEIYRLYRDPGTNQFARPTTLVADNIASNSFVDLPPADGSFMFAVTASRRGSEGTNSITRVAISDRTPPPAPTNVAVLLTANGVQVSWNPGSGETPARYNVYRNGSLIRTVFSASPIVDSPPRGIMNYTVGAADNLGNEALSAPATIELLVGAVNNFQVVVNVGQAPVLSWASGDVTTVGYNIYRNGVKQNLTPQAATSFTDLLGLVAGGSVTYSVRAVNSTNAESAARTVDVFDVALSVKGNLAGGAENSLVTRYFDSFHVTLSNLTSSGTIPLEHFEVRRTITAGPTLSLSNVVNNDVGGGNWIERDIVFPASTTTDSQAMRLRAFQQSDLAGSVVIYQSLVDFPNVSPASTMIEVTANQQPLAGGLATFTLTVFNRGYADMDFLVTRNNGTDPGDLYMSVIDKLGNEVSRTDFIGTPSGTIFTADGRGFLRIPAGGSKTFNMPNVLVPEALGTNATFFEAVITNIYYALGTAGERKSGPLSGGMVSSLAVTPYYGTAFTDRAIYADDDLVQITGQALDRVSGLPKTNATLKLGFFTRGYRYYYNVITDSNGNYAYTYTPPSGLSGTLKIWAAHPDVFDVLNQAEVKIYRLYLSPNGADIRMTKNDKLRFNVTLINPGDEVMSGFTLEANAYRLVGTNRVAITNITCVSQLTPGFVLGARQTEKISFEVTADINSPNNAILELKLHAAEGATAKFNANMTLLQPNPLLVIIDPAIGYVDLSVNRGGLLSKSVTIMNRGLRDLKGVTLQPFTNVSWISVNLPVAEDGLIHLPDLPVGGSNSFTLVFTPPTNAPLEYFQDQIRIRGTNSPAQFDIPVFALVTSSQKGSVRFYVDNLLVQSVPNATVRIKNSLLAQEYTLKTDANGFAFVPDLQEGDWAWQVTAAGHSGNVGVVNVIANNIVLVETRLSKSLVTVTFSVVPVPYTDRYEITVEQTFETHVPAPVLVLNPPHMEFKNVGPGFEATFIVKAKNYGLIQMTDVTIRGNNDGRGALTPLINYVPLLRAQEEVEIPFKFTYTAPAAPPAPDISKLAYKPLYKPKQLTRDVDENGNITGGVQFPPSFADNASTSQGVADCATGGLGGMADFIGGLMAIANACAQCVDARTAMAVAASMALTYSLFCSPNFSPTFFIPSPCPSAPPGFSFLVNLLSCLCQAFCPALGGGGGDSGGNSGYPAGPRNQSNYGFGNPACFIAGTLVLMADGTQKPIEQVKLGDRVRSGPSAVEVASVAELQSREVKEVVKVEFKRALQITSSASAAESVTASLDHDFWVDGRGWTPAVQLRAGDWLSNSDGSRSQITAVQRIPGKTKVYTFVNHNDHAFYANDLLVRDSCGDKSAFYPPPLAKPAGKEVAR